MVAVGQVEAVRRAQGRVPLDSQGLGKARVCGEVRRSSVDFRGIDADDPSIAPIVLAAVRREGCLDVSSPPVVERVMRLWRVKQHVLRAANLAQEVCAWGKAGVAEGGHADAGWALWRRAGALQGEQPHRAGTRMAAHYLSGRSAWCCGTVANVHGAAWAAG